MPTLITCLGAGKGTWAEPFRLMNAQNWSKIFLLTDDFGRQNIRDKKENMEVVLISNNQDVNMLSKDIQAQLNGKIADFEVALNLVSGTGKEHMALLHAVMSLGLNFRLVTLKNEQLCVL